MVNKWILDVFNKLQETILKTCAQLFTSVLYHSDSKEIQIIEACIRLMDALKVNIIFKVLVDSRW